MIVVCNLCVISTSIATFAWFMTTRNAEVDIFSITSNAPYFSSKIKWFRKNCKEETNELTGYPDPKTLDDTQVPTNCSDYDTEFLDFGTEIYNPGEGTNYKPWEFNNILPGNCLTFSIEIQNSTISKKHLNMMITKLTSSASSRNVYKYGQYNYIPFRLAWTMKMFIKAYDYDPSTVTENANDFIVTYMSKENVAARENVLDYGYNEPFDANGVSTLPHQILSDIPVNGNVDGDPYGINKIIFFTIEMDDDPNQQYSSVDGSTYQGKTIWTKDQYNGNQNAFKDLNFVINRMLISPVEKTMGEND